MRVRVLLTGSEGFIGKWLTKALVERGWLVYHVDLATGQNLLDSGAIPELLNELRPDRVFHLAAQVGRIFGERDLRHTVETNATMTTMLAQECGKRGIPVLYTSSSEVYGDQGTHNCIETTPCRLSHNLYGVTKYWGEQALQLYAPENLHIVRLSMPYGPGAPPGAGRRALDTFLWQAHHRMPLTVHRGSERSWCHVRDTVRGIMCAALASPGIYNVGRDDRPLSMLHLAQKSCELAGAPSDLIHEVDPPQMQTVVKRLDMTKLEATGWKPTIELDEALPEMLKWVRGFDRKGELIA